MRFILRNPFLLHRLFKTDFTVAHALIEDCTMASNDLKIRLADACLLTQRDLAQKVASTINTRVYMYCPSSYFSTPPFDTVLYDNVRTVRKDGRTALLSAAAQSVCASNCEYRSLLPPTKISEDTIGVYINP